MPRGALTANGKGKHEGNQEADHLCGGKGTFGRGLAQTKGAQLSRRCPAGTRPNQRRPFVRTCQLSLGCVG